MNHPLNLKRVNKVKKRLNKAWLFFVLSVFSILLPVYAYAQTSCSRLVLDDFTNSTNPSVLVNEANPLEQAVDDGSPGTLGAFRNITLGPYQGGSSTRVLSFVNTATGQYTLNSDVGTFAPVRIEYSANGAGLGVDISDREEFVLVLSALDVITEATVTLVDSSANNASLTLNLPELLSPTAQEFEFPFPSFTNIANVDLSNIDSVELSFVPTLFNADLEIDSFSFPCGADITVTKALTDESGTQAGIAEPGETLTYTISLQNTGGSAATYAAGEIVETVPNATTATGGDFTCTPDNSAGSSCTTGAVTVAAGATETLTFIVQVDDPIPAGVNSIDNVIVVPGECPDDDCETSTPTPLPPPPEMVPVLSPAGYLLLALGMLLLSGWAFSQRRIDTLQS